MPKIQINEVGPRDGLQNETKFVSTQAKISLVNALSETGLEHIEVTSFVNPLKIPQLADHAEVYQNIVKRPGITYSALVPNLHGMQEALTVGVQHIAIFTAASETFNQRNIGCSIQESFQRFAPVVACAKQANIAIKAYISCALGCPYEGKIAPERILPLAHQLMQFGIQELCLGDTIGVGTPKQTKDLLHLLVQEFPREQISMHFHDTYGQAVANVYASLEHEVYKFDAAVAGLGGCPYAKGASGNLATEDLLYLIHGLGLETGVDIFKIASVGHKICQLLNRPNPSKVSRALCADA